VARGLIERAQREAGVRRVLARTNADNEPSVGVLLKLGFREIDSAEPGLRRFELLDPRLPRG
jgi:RimJ/RimL family protein N-acetyltransferase